MSRDNTVITNNENKSNNFEDKSNKQIEEMAKICHFYDDGICRLCEELLVSCDRKCDLAILVENLYNAGYRKASEVALEVLIEFERFLVNKISSINYFRKSGDDFYDGEIHALELLLYKNAELKKKYTEKEGD